MGMSTQSVAAAAQRLADGRIARRAMQELPPDLRPVTVDDAYAVQDALHECLAARGAGAMAGHKVGCTTPVMQAYLGIDHPCAGGVPAATAQHGHGAFRFADFVRVGVECEIAVRLGRDLTGAVDRDAAAAAVDAVMAAIEIVDDRWQDYTSVTPPTLIADDFFAAGCVLGDGHAPGMDLRTVRGAMTVNGATVGEGTGADILGHPLNTLVWLAGTRAARDAPLRAGEFVLLGSMVKTQWLSAGDRVEVDIEGLGHASAVFA